MTETLENFTRIMEDYEPKQKQETPKLNSIINFLKLKNITSQQEDIINTYTERNKKIRNGRTVIKGTRITPEEIMLIVKEAFDNNVNDVAQLCKYIKEQYPSIDSKEKIVAGISYTIQKTNTLKFIIGVIIGIK